MPKYYFHIDHGKFSGSSDSAFDLKDDAAARQEMILACGDFARDVCLSLTENTD